MRIFVLNVECGVRVGVVVFLVDGSGMDWKFIERGRLKFVILLDCFLDSFLFSSFEFVNVK